MDEQGAPFGNGCAASLAERGALLRAPVRRLNISAKISVICGYPFEAFVTRIFRKIFLARTGCLAWHASRRYISRVIDTEQKLAAFLPKLHAASWVAVDTEADSPHAYPEKVCLIQISTIAGDVLVDPLS